MVTMQNNSISAAFIWCVITMAGPPVFHAAVLIISVGDFCKCTSRRLSVSLLFGLIGVLATTLCLKWSHFCSNSIVLSRLQCKTAYVGLLYRKMAQGLVSPPGSTGRSPLNRRPSTWLS